MCHSPAAASLAQLVPLDVHRLPPALGGVRAQRGHKQRGSQPTTTCPALVDDEHIEVPPPAHCLVQALVLLDSVPWRHDRGEWLGAGS